MSKRRKNVPITEAALLHRLQRAIENKPLILWSGKGDLPPGCPPLGISLVAGDGDLVRALTLCFFDSDELRNSPQNPAR
jgi:hypothetical protein